MKQHALEISELRLHIAAHLDLDSLKACVRVCHAWYNDLQSLVWARFNVDGCKLRESQRKQRASRLASLRKHSRFIKHIVRQGRRLTAVDRVEAYTILADQCRSLESIDMSLLDEHEWELYRRLVRLNPGLCQITISGIIQPITATPIDYQPVSLVHGHPFLKQLAVDCPTTLSTILRVLEACPSIEQLVIGCDKKDVRSQLDP
ncbi:hypothetical protein BGW42_004935 [Actinomortierella wolfii]|nr:hypothetical protein BGW42_004935 [Actinomortierella wolfii]